MFDPKSIFQYLRSIAFPRTISTMPIMARAKATMIDFVLTNGVCSGDLNMTFDKFAFKRGVDAESRYPYRE
ncbi:hypothetical protein GCM10027287_05300 [Bordetella muralis]